MNEFYRAAGYAGDLTPAPGSIPYDQRPTTPPPTSSPCDACKFKRMMALSSNSPPPSCDEVCNPNYRAPTNAPTYGPTNVPTNAPTNVPIYDPTRAPTMAPTYAPTYSPTKNPRSAQKSYMQNFRTMFNGGSKSKSVVMIGLAVISVVIVIILLLKKK